MRKFVTLPEPVNMQLNPWNRYYMYTIVQYTTYKFLELTEMLVVVQ